MKSSHCSGPSFPVLLDNEKAGLGDVQNRSGILKGTVCTIMQGFFPFSAPNKRQTDPGVSWAPIPTVSGITWLPLNSVWGWDGLHSRIPALRRALSGLGMFEGLLANKRTGLQANKQWDLSASLTAFSFPTVPSIDVPSGMCPFYGIHFIILLHIKFHGFV